MVTDGWSLLSRFQRVVKKVKVLLSLDINRWRLVASMIGASSISNNSRRLSFNGASLVTKNSGRLSFNERAGLKACVDDTESEDCSARNNDFSPRFELHRTISNQSEDDIDKRAELFIENFRRQLQIERQISLELKYFQGDNNSFKLMSP
ncbi:uncharacterized protein LOC126670046 [Mercurialis annua]|uniref:uncharacterized protein LOC126670046 n=1 Tax=Mercurialis annua TaxID=3986 RepID=UPI00215E3395|nr:uncharacterized protein LOC126670046 [Mercurialis annua]